MLRASSDRLGHSPDLRGLVDLGASCSLPLAAELLAFTDATVLRDDHELESARAALDAVGSTAIVTRAAAVAGNFDMMNRLVDAAGIPYDTQYLGVTAELGIKSPSSH